MRRSFKFASHAFLSRSAPSHLASSRAPGAIRNSCVPRQRRTLSSARASPAFKGFKRSQCVKPAWSLKLIGAWQFFLATHRWPELNTWHCEGVGCARARTPAKHLRGNYSRIQEPAQAAQACKVNRTESQGGYRRRETKTNCSRVGVIPRSRRVGHCKGLKRDRPVPVPSCCVAADFRLPLRHQSSRLPMVKLTVVPVIPLALSEAMKTAMFATSSSVMTRRGWVVPARYPWNCSQVMPAAFALRS